MGEKQLKATEEELDRWRNVGFDAVITSAQGEHARGTFRGLHELSFSEPEFVDLVGDDEHPCPHDYLLAAVGGCQMEILKQCLEKGRVGEYDVRIDIRSRKSRTEVPEEIPENADLRVAEISSEVSLTVPEAYSKRASRCIEIFEDHCPISQSVVSGIDLQTDTEFTVAE